MNLTSPGRNTASHSLRVAETEGTSDVTAWYQVGKRKNSETSLQVGRNRRFGMRRNRAEFPDQLQANLRCEEYSFNLLGL